ALEIGSPTADPQFTAPATGNFLPANPVLQNAGNNLLAIVPADINGIPRATLPTIGAYESLPTNINDAAAMTLLSPEGMFCSGSRPVQVIIRNAGTNNINTVQVNWSVNGIVQTPFAYSGLLVPSTATTGQNTDTVLLGNANIIAGANTINVWTSLPNGVTDTDISNDSVNTSLSTTNFTVNALSDTVCTNTPVNITLSPSSGYVNEIITWESSADGLSWTTIAGANTPALSLTSLGTTTYFRAKVTNSGIACTTAAEQVAVIAPAITASTPAERCGPGPLTLSATSSGGDVNWYSAATGGAPLHTGTSFTTPGISNTTTYYAAAVTGSSGGNIPELMYYRFDVPGTTVPNEASSPVGTNPAPVTGLTIGGTGQFGTGLQGNAGATASNRVNPQWTGTHTGSWTISFWMNVPTPPTTRYMFGNTLGNGTFRCFIGGAANGIRLTGGVPSVTLDMPSWNATGAKVITYVYDQSAGTVSGYINGVFQASVTPGASYPLVGTNFVVGSQGTSIDGTMDEFRMYNRALTAAEVASFWNTPLAGGCESARVPVVATINEIPLVDLGNDTVICPSATLTLDATAPASGLTYLWNTGATTPTINVSTTGTYSVSVANSNCTGYDTINIGNAPVPAAVLPDSSDICDGTIITLDAGNNGATYLWNDGSSNQTLEVATAGLYTVNITNPQNCSIQDSTFVTVNAIPLVDLGNDTTICIGAGLVLDAQNNGADYLWNTGDQTQAITIDEAGSYSVTVTNAQQCSASDTIEVSTYEAAAVNGFNFTPRFDLEPGRVDFVPVDPMFVNSYHWDFGDGNTSVTQNPSHIYTNSGNYLVTLTVTNDCGSKDTSLLINVDLFVGVKDAGRTDLNIDVFPVPATDDLTIASKDAGVLLKSATVVNMTGQTFKVPYRTKDSKLLLDLSTFTSGNYTIIIQTNKGIFYRKINILK
ncbi:MAG: PKD domain-containing protein, partial [Taibaiella sp.]|nr:PKD domain-containing protein [Taibaiella sp.]